MLKMIRKVCRGIDAHKKFVVATTNTTNMVGATDYQTLEFQSFTENLV